MSPQTEGASNIGQVMRSLAGTHQRGGIASSRLGTVFADSLSYFALRAKLEEWTVWEVPRPAELPVSATVALFAQEVTRGGKIRPAGCPGCPH